MAIAKELLRIRQAKTAIKQAIANKGVEVGSERIDELAPLIDKISGGGGGASAQILNQLRSKISLDDAKFADLGFASLNVREVEDMSNLFNGCINLKKPDMTGWNLSGLKVATMMFQGCIQLTSIIGDYTQEDVDNGLKVLEGLKCSLDLAQTKLAAPSVCAVLQGCATIEAESAMINLSVEQYEAVKNYADIDYIAMAKQKGWLIGRGGCSDETLVDEIAGTIIGKDENGEIKYVKYADFMLDSFDTSKFTPVSVLTIPRSHTKDGKCRGISLMNMAIATPEQGSNANPTMYWGVYGVDETLTNYTSATTGNVPVGDTLGVTATPYLPTDAQTAVPSVVDTLAGITQSAYGNSTPYMPSPYMDGGKPNPQYWEGSSANKIQCNTDMDGVGNTQVIIDKLAGSEYAGVLIPNSGAIGNVQQNYPAFACCYRYQGGGYTDHSWYLPSCGEMGYFIVRWTAINNALTAIRAKYGNTAAATIPNSTWHWSSSECHSGYARLVMPNSGQVNYSDKRTSYVVRAFHAF